MVPSISVRVATPNCAFGLSILGPIYSPILARISPALPAANAAIIGASMSVGRRGMVFVASSLAWIDGGSLNAGPFTVPSGSIQPA